jgi:hypothetical protein
MVLMMKTGTGYKIGVSIRALKMVVLLYLKDVPGLAIVDIRV